MNYGKRKLKKNWLLQFTAFKKITAIINIQSSNTKLTEVYSTIRVEQGCVLSPQLLIILKDDIVKLCKRETKPLDMGNWLIKTC
jgi:hypothetical protein